MSRTNPQPVHTARRLRKARRAGVVLARVTVTALAAGVLSATLVRFSPGFGVDERQLDARLSGESQQAIQLAYDGERSPARFYLAYLRGMAAGDFGFSHSLGRPIRELLAERAPVTAELMAYGVAGAWLLALAFATPPSWRSNLDGYFSAFSGIPACLPAAGIALLLFRLGASEKWMIPVILFPRLYQYLRNLLRQGYATPHVLLARAKGVSRVWIFLRHVLVPAGGPLLALAAVSVNMAFGAAVAVEAICDLPGIGQLAWKAALARDLPVLVILTMMIALVTQFSNLAADVFSPATRSHA